MGYPTEPRRADTTVLSSDLAAAIDELKAKRAGELAPGRDQILAAISAVHTSASDLLYTDWSQVAARYDRLVHLHPSPIIALNRAIAVAELDGPEVALAAVDRLEHKLAGYHLYHSTRADYCAGWATVSSHARPTTKPSSWRQHRRNRLTRRRDQLG